MKKLMKTEQLLNSNAIKFH